MTECPYDLDPYVVETQDGKRIVDHWKLPLGVFVWLIKNAPSDVRFVSCCFPSPSIRDEYIETIQERPEDEVVLLIRTFLMPSGTIGHDTYLLENLKHFLKNDPERADRLLSHGLVKRLRHHVLDKEAPPPWEGITWVLDLLPREPLTVVQIIRSYIDAHAQLLTDQRYDGLLHARALIRAKFIESPETAEEAHQILRSIDRRDFEFLVGHLYRQQGYDVKVTSATKDGGKDVIATKSETGASERIFIECKRPDVNRVSVSTVRELRGIIEPEGCNKGVIISSLGFTKAAMTEAERDYRIELVGPEDLLRLLNAHCGSTWHTYVDIFVDTEKRKQGSEKRA